MRATNTGTTARQKQKFVIFGFTAANVRQPLVCTFARCQSPFAQRRGPADWSAGGAQVVREVVVPGNIAPTPSRAHLADSLPHPSPEPRSAVWVAV